MNKLAKFLKELEVVRDFEDVFLDEVLGLPPKKEVYFPIKLIP